MSYVKVMGKYEDNYEPYIREILTYECQCKYSTQFTVDELDFLHFKHMPSVFHWSRMYEWPWCLEEGCFQPHHKVLDIGSSWGCLKYAIASRVAEVVANDHDGEALKKAKETADFLGFSNIKWDYSDLLKMPHESDYFDRVCCISVLEHVQSFSHKDYIRELIRVLKPGGKLLMSLDIRVNGYDTGEFCVDLRKFKNLVEYLNLSYPDGQTGKQARIDTVDIVVGLINWTKPLDWKN